MLSKKQVMSYSNFLEEDLDQIQNSGRPFTIIIMIIIIIIFITCNAHFIGAYDQMHSSHKGDLIIRSWELKG